MWVGGVPNVKIQNFDLKIKLNIIGLIDIFKTGSHIEPRILDKYNTEHFEGDPQLRPRIQWHFAVLGLRPRGCETD